MLFQSSDKASAGFSDMRNIDQFINGLASGDNWMRVDSNHDYGFRVRSSTLDDEAAAGR